MSRRWPRLIAIIPALALLALLLAGACSAQGASPPDAATRDALARAEESEIIRCPRCRRRVHRAELNPADPAPTCPRCGSLWNPEMLA